MRLLLFVLVPAALLAGQPRFARLGEFQGPVEVQLTAADPWIAAERNLPLPESAWLRTGAGGRVEIEMDDGSAWRLGPNSLGEISDYARLSTGQRITLLSLDHGTAYYTGQPAAKDVTMLVMPGAQMTVLQGSRVRQTAQPGVSQAAILEGEVRWSSPTAEMELREGTTAQVEPANASRFSLTPAVTAQALDKWSEDRDKAEGAPASAAYVNAAYGLADLDSGGTWIPAGDLGVVWKPEVPDGWTPYRNGRWRYYDTLGYTWVSDDSWGWLPYHNGRWTVAQNMGWVWQPGAAAAFHPAEVYWLRGTNFAGWGPLAPGEEWTAPNPGAVTPQAYTAGSTSFAGFQADARMIDGATFAAPGPQQLKTAFFVPALPSPAFLMARLDALRPILQVGSTRVIPSVPGVAFGDATEPPADLMTNPPDDTTTAQPVADAGIPPLPDGVYPVPTVVVPTVDTEVMIGPGAPDHPTYSMPRPSRGSQTTTATTGSNQPSRSTGSTSTGSTSTSSSSSPPPPGTSSPKPARPTEPPPSSGTGGRPTGDPLHNHPVTPPVSKPKTDDTAGKKPAASVSEQELYRQVLQDIDPKQPDFTKALADLYMWSHRYPKSAFSNERSYFLIHVYDRTGRPAQVLDTAAPLVDVGVLRNYGDPQQVLQILVAASSSLAKLRAPTGQQAATAQQAAHQLQEFLPQYFAHNHKPADVSEAAWTSARQQLEAIAHDALAHTVPLSHVATAH